MSNALSKLDDRTPGEVIVHAVEGNLPDTLDECDRLMQSVNTIGWMAQARICQHVRDARLYTERFETFEACCNELWSLSRSRVHRMIEGAEVAANVAHGQHAPASERQARPLTKLPPAEQAEAWEEVVAESEQTGEKITAKKVEQVVAKRRAVDLDPLHFRTDTATDLDTLISAGQRFACIYADPPWRYGNQATRGATDNHYPTMAIEDIKALPVADLADDDAHLHLWTTTSFLAEALQVIESWGFTYKSQLIWTKPQIGLGNYWRVSHEILLLGVRGRCPFLDKSMPSWIEAPREAHSVKPQVFRQAVERVSPGPRIELFARQASPGWTAWGNQVDAIGGAA